MSRSVELFVQSGASLAELAAAIAARRGLRIDDSVGPGSRVLSDGHLSAVLHEHRWDDADLPISRYRYALTLRTTVAGHLGLSPETAFLRAVAAELSDHAVLLVLGRRR